MGRRKGVKQEDIAKELGISVVSVSNVLHGKRGVSEAVRNKVLEKAQELGYQLSTASERKEERSWRIGVIMAERYVREYPSFYMEIYRQAAQNVAKRGSLTVLEIVDEDKEKLRYSRMPFEKTVVHGILLIGEMNMEYIRRVKRQSGVPVVCIDFYSTEQDMDYIVSDGFHGMQQVTQSLIDYGHREIGFVGTVYATNSIMDRYMGYCKALQINGLKEYEEWVLDDREKDGYGYLLDVILPKKLPTAFACNCDKSACILIDKLEKQGIRVPGDISVVGFDHFSQASEEGYELVTYESDWKSMAQLGVRTLFRRMEGGEPSMGVRVVKGNVVVGNTMKRIER